MSYHAMPFIYLNMGGELIYILNYRLQKQNIDRLKGVRVLGDLVGTLLNKKCLEVIFEPQDVHSRDSLRRLFEEIANSSAMRLSKDSMDQLFELMVVPVKYQTLLCKEPSELVLVTLNHLNGIKECFSDPTPVLDHINYAQTLFMDNFVETPLWEMASIRSTILNFFLGSQVKLTRLVNENRQLADGRFVLFSENNTERNKSAAENEIQLPYGSMAPGTVRYTVSGGPLRVETFPVAEKFKPLLEHQERAVSRGTVLGQNMFKTNPGPQEKENVVLTAGKDAGSEVQLLSRLLSGAPDNGAGSLSQTFNLSLFEEDELDARPQPQDIPTFATSNPPANVSADKKDPARRKKSLTSTMKQMKSSSQERKGRGEEMLKMMDELAKSTNDQPRPRKDKPDDGPVA